MLVRVLPLISLIAPPRKHTPLLFGHPEANWGQGRSLRVGLAGGNSPTPINICCSCQSFSTSNFCLFRKLRPREEAGLAQGTSNRSDLRGVRCSHPWFCFNALGCHCRIITGENRLLPPAQVPDALTSRLPGPAPQLKSLIRLKRLCLPLIPSLLVPLFGVWRPRHGKGAVALKKGL